MLEAESQPTDGGAKFVCVAGVVAKEEADRVDEVLVAPGNAGTALESGLRNVDVAAEDILVHDATRHDSSLAFALARLNSDDASPTPFGIFRDVQRTEYASAVNDQLIAASEAKGPADLQSLLRSNGTWTV